MNQPQNIGLEYIDKFLPVAKLGKIFDPINYRDTKDPCAIYVHDQLHIFGTAGNSLTEEWNILHAYIDQAEANKWHQEKVEIHGVTGPQICAPGITFDSENNIFHMFTQTACFEKYGEIVHLVSSDNGKNFHYQDTCLQSIPDSEETGIYDPHPAELLGKKYLVYSGFPEVGRGDIYLAESVSDTWNGPWKRSGKILAHSDVSHHNQHDNPDYEWGLEGAQLTALKNGKILLNAVCFLPYGTRGTRQRVFFALSDNITGPYHPLGPVITPSEQEWDSGENGHASILLQEEKMQLFYQARSQNLEENQWRYGLAEFPLSDFESWLQY